MPRDNKPGKFFKSSVSLFGNLIDLDLKPKDFFGGIPGSRFLIIKNTGQVFWIGWSKFVSFTYYTWKFRVEITEGHEGTNNVLFPQLAK